MTENEIMSNDEALAICILSCKNLDITKQSLDYIIKLKKDYVKAVNLLFRANSFIDLDTDDAIILADELSQYLKELDELDE